MTRRRLLALAAPVTLAAPAAISTPLLAKPARAAELSGGPWFNTPGNKPLTLAGLRGKVTVVHFWTFGCINCRRNLPSYANWRRKFPVEQVEIIGVHSPEFPHEAVVDNVGREVAKHKIDYPVLVDSKMDNWRRWNQQYWPAVYLVDKKGFVREHWDGELNYGGQQGEAKFARKIEELIAEAD